MESTDTSPAAGADAKPPRLWLATAILLGLAGCATPTSAPRELVPLDIPGTWSNQVIGLTDVLTPLAQWWLRFDDAALTDLVNLAMDNNTDIAIARATLSQAQANCDLAASALSPTLSASAIAQRSLTGESARTDRLQVGLNAALDPDLFGTLGKSLDASRAAVQAAQARLGAAQSQVAQALALNYITLRSTQVRLLIAQDNLASQLETLQITRWRSQAGLIGAVEVEQALVAAGQTRAQMPPLQVALESALHSLAVQIGQPPSSLGTLLRSAATVPQAVEGLTPGSPLETLNLRPQVRGAKFDVEQALARAEQARAARLPSLALSANLGLGAATLETLSSSAALVAALALSVATPLLDGGAGEARVNLQESALIQAQANYRAARLNALQEVEDAMSALRANREHLSLLQQLALSAYGVASLAQQRFSAGLVDFQIVLETQRNLLSIQNSLAQSWADVSTDQVRLYSALGGGWNPNAAPVAAKTTP